MQIRGREPAPEFAWSHFCLLLSVTLSVPNKKRLKPLLCDFTQFLAAPAHNLAAKDTF